MKTKLHFLEKNLLLILFVLAFTVTSKAQNLQKCRQYSYYTYIYKIENKQAKDIFDVSSWVSLTENMLKLPVDSFLTDSLYKKTLPVGNYVYVHASGNNLHYQLNSITSMDAYLYVDKKQILFFPYIKSNLQPVTNAVVLLNKHKAIFDAKTHAYKFKRPRKESSITVTTDTEQAYFSIEKQEREYDYDHKKFSFKKLFRKNHKNYDDDGDDYYNTKYNSGYIAFNKPKYLPKDTVKFKAMVLTQKGKYFTGDVEVRFGKEYRDNKKLVILKPTSPGAYVYQFVLGDSLALNEMYYIEIWDTKTGKQLIQRNNFELEDYQLNEASYHIKTTKENYIKDEPVTLYISGKDANGFNLLDTRVDIKVKVNYTSSYLADYVFVPNILWSTTQNLDPLGETKIVIPDSVFPAAIMNMEIRATFNNSNNETHDTTISFKYAGLNKKIETKLDDEFVKADYFLNGKSISFSGKLVKRIHDQNVEEKITYPYKEKINPSVSEYTFFAGDLQKYLNSYEDHHNYYYNTFYIGGHRTKDSVFIKTQNPYGLEATYTILKGNKEIEKGTTSNLNKQIKDDSKEPYYVRYHYTWLGQVKDYTSSIQLYDKVVNVKIDQPIDIYPGQKTQVKIKVTDNEKKPVENVNLTAFSINSQFDLANNDEVSYLGNIYRKNPYTDKYELTIENELSGDLPLSTSWRNKMRLDTMSYYKMLYPKNGLHNNYDSVKTINAQFAPFLFDKGTRVPIYIIFVDNNPVYYYDTDNADEYSFITSVGYHTIRIRTIDKDYRIDSVFLREGIKTDFALDVNNLPKNITVLEKTKELTYDEKISVKNSIISISDVRYEVNYLWQDNKTVLVSGSTYNYNTKGFYKYGGFFPGKINFAVQNKYARRFTFEPGYDYTITEDEVKMRNNWLFEGNIILNKTGKLYPAMGLKATLLNTIKLKTAGNWYTSFETNFPRNTTDGNGAYCYNYTGDSTICLIRVQKCDNDSLTRCYAKSTYNNTFADLQPGYYNLTFVTPNKYFIQKDSVKILGNGLLFQRFGDTLFQKYNSLDKKDTAKQILKTNWQTPKEISIFNSYVYENLKGAGAIKVTLFDKKTKEGMPFANVVLIRRGVQVAVGTTDIDGVVSFRPLPTGCYTVKATYVGYNLQQIKDVIVTNEKTSYIQIPLSNDNSVSLDVVTISEYSMPLIDADTKSGGTISRENFQMMAAKDVNSVVSTQAGVVFVDGERSIGTNNLPQSAVEQMGVLGGLPAQYGDVTGGIVNAKQIRNKFSDYAYWQPNLITDKNGEVRFEVKFPDNVTKWESHAMAMDDKKHSGNGYATTKAYKNIMANLAMPRFILQGDSAMIIGKTLNYTNNPVKVNTQFIFNNKLLTQHDTTVKNAVIEKVLITPTNLDSVTITYAAQQFEGAKDGEERSIPVLPVGVEETNGVFFALNQDTTFTINIDSGLTEIYIQDNPLDFMLKEIEQLKNYPYWCMEQTASKLNALLMEEKIKNKLHEHFKNEKETKKLINKLKQAQKANGSWGWWQESADNIWMTAYIARILNRAKQANYAIENLEKAKQYLLWNLSPLKGNELLSVLNTCSEMNIPVPYVEYLKRFEKDSLSLYQKFLITKIKQENKLPYNLDLILKTKKQSVLKSMYWGSDNYSWYDNSTNISLLAYKILEREDSNSVHLPYIRNYFLELKNQYKWRNTIETANILETILPALLKQSGNKINLTKVILSGAVNKTVSTFPYKAVISKNEKLTITKSGSSSAFFTSYQTKWNSNPAKKEDYYKIKTYYEVNGKKTDTLHAGITADLVVEIIASKKAEFVMLDIPIPAGCSYDDNKLNVNYYEVHREYFKNKTSIFCEELAAGKHIFKVKLQPRFTGTYNINPAKAELMYFPVFYGRNEIKKVSIK